MIDDELKDIDIEEIEDLLLKVEKSFNIKFGNAELIHIKTFGELCDYIANKIQLDHSDDCTTQQAFYKLRNAISSKFKIDSKTISTDFPLINLLPIQNRRTMTAELERFIGVKLNILRPPHWLTGILAILIVVSFLFLILLVPFVGPLFGLRLNWQIGVLGLGISIGGLWLANKFGNELDVQTIGQVAAKMTRENYLKSRRISKTFNKSEIEKILVDLFSNDLELDKSKLVREAILKDDEKMGCC
jgi:hypothetical protein